MYVPILLGMQRNHLKTVIIASVKKRLVLHVIQTACVIELGHGVFCSHICLLGCYSQVTKEPQVIF